MSDKIQILHVIETLDVGGAENILVEIVNNLDSKYDVTICCVKNSGNMASNVLRKGTRILELNKSEGNDYSIPWKMAKFIRSNDVRLVHSHNWGVFCESALAARVGGAKTFIHTVHGDFHSNGNGYVDIWKRKLRHFVERCFAGWGATVVAVSEDVKKVIHSKTGIPLEKISVIRNGIRLKTVDEENKRKIIQDYCITENDFVIITVGRLVPVKNIPCLIEAIGLIHLDINNIKVLIVGDGPERSNIGNMIKSYKLDNRIYLVGEKIDIPEYLSVADLYVLPSKHEGISISLLEAMGAGLPIIATSVGGNIEVLEKDISGMLIPSDDPKVLAMIIMELYNDEEKRIRLGAAAQEKRKREFDLERMVFNYEKLYAHLLG